jgi:hypothetical protein
MAIVPLWGSCALAGEHPRVLLLRGWFGVASTGLEALADEPKAKGIRVEVAGHLYWETASRTVFASGRLARSPRSSLLATRRARTM